MNKNTFNFIIGLLSAIGIILLLLQLIPYGRAHHNPPTTQEPAWDSIRTRELVVRACFDCHSNETVWPWYSHIAPFSWVVHNDVDAGREEVNFSEWDTSKSKDNTIYESVVDGSMPLKNYLLTHPEAKLSAEEMEALLVGLQATFGGGEED